MHIRATRFKLSLPSELARRRESEATLRLLKGACALLLSFS